MHIQDVLAIEFPIHQHISDVNEGLSRVQGPRQSPFVCLLSAPDVYLARLDSIPDQLDGAHWYACSSVFSLIPMISSSLPHGRQ